jgi:hypothetical protein
MTETNRSLLRLIDSKDRFAKLLSKVRPLGEAGNMKSEAKSEEGLGFAFPKHYPMILCALRISILYSPPAIGKCLKISVVVNGNFCSCG